MDKETYVSILIPTYKRPDMLERCLKKCISAVSSEIQPHFELIVSDNATMQENREVFDRELKGWGGGSQFLTDDTGRNMQQNWNALSNAATGNYIQYVHDDDYLIEGSGALLLKAARDHDKKQVTVCFSNQLVDLDEKVLKVERKQEGFLAKREAIKMLASQSSGVRFPCMFIPRTLLQSVGNFKEQAEVQDWPTWLELSLREGLQLSSQVTCAYTVHLGAETNNMFNEKVLNELIGLLKEYSEKVALSEAEVITWVSLFCYRWMLAGTWRAWKQRDFALMRTRLGLEKTLKNHSLVCPPRYRPAMVILRMVLGSKKKA